MRVAPRLRVLMVSDVYFPRVNGVSTSIATFRRTCAAWGHRIDLLAPDYGHGPALLQAAGRLGARYDLIHVQTPFVAHYAGLRLARRWQVPVVATYHTYFEEYLHHYVPVVPRAGMRVLARRLSRRQCNALDAMIVPSTAMLEILRGYGVATPARVIPTGVAIEEFRHGDGDRFRIAHDIALQRPVLLFVGRAAFEKNLEFLLAVTARVRQLIPDVLLLIAGEGPALRSLRNRARAAGLEHHVRWVGYLSRQRDLSDCYRAADVFVFASRTETQGLVLLEAMACGRPLVSTAVMGTRDVLDGARGVAVAPENVEAFAQRLLLLLRDPKLRARLGRAARKDAESWSAASMAARLCAFYADLVAARAGASQRPLNCTGRRPWL